MGWVWANLPQRKHDFFLSCTAALALLIEVGLIDLQQWRGVPSHFNRATILDSAIYNTMGLLILWVTGVIILLTIRSFTQALSQPVPMVIADSIWSHIPHYLMPPRYRNQYQRRHSNASRATTCSIW